MGDPFTAKKLKELLNTKYGYNIFKIIDCLSEKIYMAYIYFKTDEERMALTDSEKEKIKSIVIEYLETTGEIPNEIERTIFYFDSDENVQKNFGGSYFYATR